MFTMDTKAMHYILTNTNTYQKSPQSREGLSRIIGPGRVITQFRALLTNIIL